MSDYKYEMQQLAEQAAEEQYGKDFSELPPDVQGKLYSDAMDDWGDQQSARAEDARDAARDREMGL